MRMEHADLPRSVLGGFCMVLVQPAKNTPFWVVELKLSPVTC